jgi:hypothetical protein
VLALVAWPVHAAGGAEESHDHYRARLRPPASLAAILEHVEPGKDGFPEETIAAELAARLEELSRLLRARPARDVAPLLAVDFKGARLSPLEANQVESGALEVVRAKRMSQEPSLECRRGRAALLVDGWTRCAWRVPDHGHRTLGEGRARSDVRFDIVGQGRPPGAASERVRADRLGRDGARVASDRWVGSTTNRAAPRPRSFAR